MPTGKMTVLRPTTATFPTTSPKTSLDICIAQHAYLASRSPTSFRPQIGTHPTSKKPTAQTSASHLIPFPEQIQASHAILISESHVFQHLHLRIDVAIAPSTSCRGWRGCRGCDLATPGIDRGCSGDTSGDRFLYRVRCELL